MYTKTNVLEFGKKVVFLLAMAAISHGSQSRPITGDKGNPLPIHEPTPIQKSGVKEEENYSTCSSASESSEISEEITRSLSATEVLHQAGFSTKHDGSELKRIIKMFSPKEQEQFINICQTMDRVDERYNNTPIETILEANKTKSEPAGSDDILSRTNSKSHCQHALNFEDDEKNPNNGQQTESSSDESIHYFALPKAENVSGEVSVSSLKFLDSVFTPTTESSEKPGPQPESNTRSDGLIAYCMCLGQKFYKETSWLLCCLECLAWGEDLDGTILCPQKCCPVHGRKRNCKQRCCYVCGCDPSGDNC